MSIKAVLFDLDGTLLPMDLEKFMKLYLSAISSRMAELGYNPKATVDAVLRGSYAMIKNDGGQLNSDVFWGVFCEIFGKDAILDKPKVDAFYLDGFDVTRAACSYNPEVPRLISFLKERGLRLILATNPLFPPIATEKRMEWAGLDKADFELYTTYENSHFCKPNLDYYREILNSTALSAEECLMIGNDTSDDMVAKALGMKVFLLIDCLINAKGEDISQYPHGSFTELYAYLNETV